VVSELYQGVSCTKDPKAHSICTVIAVLLMITSLYFQNTAHLSDQEDIIQQDADKLDWLYNKNYSNCIQCRHHKNMPSFVIETILG
jgi:hypothetical protein